MTVILGTAWPISGSVVERLGWVLVHSLWQFALVALLAGAFVRALHRRSAATRYGLLIVAMAVSLTAPLTTWILQPGDAPDRSAGRVESIPALVLDGATSRVRDTSPRASTSSMASDPATVVRIPAQPTSNAALETPRASMPPAPANIHPTPTWPERAATALRPWLAWLVAGWGLGVVVCSLRPVLGWRMLWRLRREGVSAAPAEVLAALPRVSKRLGLRRAVHVLQSRLAQVPVVIGYVRPVILLPVSLVTSIPAAQLEAILAHELAHVRRHDFAINLLQTFVETIFFYHPAMWWLSRRIRVEREHCCDDLVVQVFGDRVEYGRALLAVEEQRGRNPLLALGAADGSLLSRVRRIVGVEPDRNTVSLVGHGSAALLGLTCLGAALALSMNWNVAAKEQLAPQGPPVVDDFGPESHGLRGRLVAVPTTVEDTSPDITTDAREKSSAAPTPPAAPKSPDDKNAGPRAAAPAGTSAPPRGLEFLAPYPKLHELSLGMTERQFLAISDHQKLKLRKSTNGGSTTYSIPTGDGHTVIVMFRNGNGACSGIQRVRGEDPPKRVNPDRAELKPEDIFARQVSLAAKETPLKDALAAVARAARIELQLEAAALKEVGLDVEKPVTAKIKDEPLGEAIGKLINGEKHQEILCVIRNGKLIITTLQAHQADVKRHLPEWLKDHYNRGLLASLDDDHNVVSITAGAVMSDELLGKLRTLPKLRKLDIETTKRITPAGLKGLAELSSLQKLTVYSLSHDGTGLGDAVIRNIVGLKSLRELHLHQCGTTDAGFRLLETMSQLTLLDVNAEPRLTDAAIASVAKLKRLKHLSLNSYVGTEDGWMRFSTEALRKLAGLRDLEHLHLVGQNVSAETLNFPRLQSLSLGAASVDDTCAARLAECRQLQTLNLVYTKITDEGLRKIADLPDLQRLNLDSRVVTDAGIKHLSRLPKLRHVSLRASQVTDEALRHLAEIKSLTRVDLHGSGEPGVNPGTCFTIAGVQRLKALPNLRTLWLTNFKATDSYLGLKELTQLRELTLMMANIRDDELDALEEALPSTRIHHATGGGFSRVRSRR